MLEAMITENTTNFLRETIEYLQERGKKPEDVSFVYVYDYWRHGRSSPNENPIQCGKWEDFARLADRPRARGWAGCQTGIERGLVIVGQDFWIERHSNDEFGTQWWEFKCLPEHPTNYVPLEEFIRIDGDWDEEYE